MATLSAVLAVVLVGVTSVEAQRASTTSEHIWSSSVWVLYGERIPLYEAGYPQALTPLGAQQMYSQGSLLRARYLSQFDDDDADVTSMAPIVGIGRNAIDNSQLNVYSTTERYATAGALAFMQGLYPPVTQAFSNATGGMDAALLANGSLVNYPLGGYQYPDIQTMSLLDRGSLWLQGQTGCTNYLNSMLDFPKDSAVISTSASAATLYSRIWAQLFPVQSFPGLGRSAIDFKNAYEVYDYAQYHYNHDNSTGIDDNDLANLRLMAAAQQRFKNGNLTSWAVSPGDNIRAVAGRTMVSKVVDLLQGNIRTNGSSNKLSVAFTGLEPFTSFFALSKLNYNSNSKQTFMRLPHPGSMMVFELFSVGGSESLYPSTDQLRVRFLYRDGTDSTQALNGYSLFDSGPHNYVMNYTGFVDSMDQVGLQTPTDWCNLCGQSLLCSSWNPGGPNSNSGSNPTLVTAGDNGRTAISPPIAGVIGAVVTLAVTGLAVLAAMLIGGVRFHRADPKTRNSTLGGFKGAEKMASDTDLADANGGMRHERTGSWELRNSGKDGLETNVVPVADAGPVTAGATVVSRDLTHPSKTMDDDAISEMGHSPVDAREF
ncbi:histidine phosphatase superfamily [Podospora didyma]|uniref:Histidine phosphatase superfamily n=1 Tax=Podospora didyma TaxID=330526 RepID=A0AAE0U135_9PEZI|nr:histidine phosphatase superfamily [Podospora didyma]